MSEKSYLYKNPEFVEKKRENFDAIIINKNGKFAYYYKDDATELEYGEWFIFESPQGFFLAKSGKDKSELMDTFHEHYKIKL